MIRTVALLVFVLVTRVALAAGVERPRLVVFTDIGGDPDDQQSLVRLMFYANELQIEGLYATSRLEHGPEPRPALIHAVIDGYDKVVPALRRHDPRYPSASSLRGLVFEGRPGPTREHPGEIGPGHDTPASRHAEALFARADRSRPLHVALWGGGTDFAQALDALERRLSAAALARALAGIRVYAIGDQDGAGAIVKRRYLDLVYVEGAHRFESLYRGMYQNDARAGVPLVRDEVAALNQEAWIRASIVAACPELGALYPASVAQNPATERNRRGVKEGDTPSWFYVLPTGLGNPAEPTWGGWGGRFQPIARGLYQDAEDDHWSGQDDVPLRRKWTVARWRADYQNDFAARARWCTTAPREANHPPRVLVAGAETRVVRGGQRQRLDARGTSDRDRQTLTFAWWIYREPSSWKGEVELLDTDARVATLVAPAVVKPETVHVVLTVTDAGSPPLTRYRRVVVTVVP